MMDRHTSDYLTETAQQSYQQTRVNPALAPPMDGWGMPLR